MWRIVQKLKIEKETEMKLNELFPSNLLKAADVTDAGGEMPLTIAKIEMKDFDNDSGGKERKPIIFFANDKQMVCNKTNGTTLGEMFGNETDDWLGKSITLIVQNVDFAGKSTPAIRIKNLNSKDMLIQNFWAKSREMGFTRQDGLDHLKQFNGDFKTALEALTETQPF
jgi:hypothetical protein